MKCVIEGVGETDYSRNSGRTTNQLAMEAILNACRDAELPPRQIDGIISYGDSTSAEEVASHLDLCRLSYSITVSMGGASSVASLNHARHAIESGSASHVLIMRSRNGNSGRRAHDRQFLHHAQGLRQNLEFPFGWNTAAQRYSMICRRYMAEYGLTREQLGAVALSARHNAQLNPRAQMYGRELSMEMYLKGRTIADPYTLFDSCLETDGACAVIVGPLDRAAPRQAHASIVSVAEGQPATPDDLSNRPNLLAIGLDQAAADAWDEAGLGPEDMDAAMIYDCFTFEVIHQLESAGFAAPGMGGTYVEQGNIDLNGKLPVNTHGGLLSEGHMAGLNHVIEAARQLRGEADQRQLHRVEHIAVTGWGGLGSGSMAVLARAGGGR